MRILQISSSRTFGGGERHFVDLCRGLQKRGHEVFAAVRPTNVWERRLDFLPADRVFHVSIRNSFGILSASRMAAFAREKQIDIIHAHVARDYIPASIACSLTGGQSKFVLTRHVVFPLKPFNRFALKNLTKAIAVSSGVETALMNVFPKTKIRVILNGIETHADDLRDRAAAGTSFRKFHGIPADSLVVGTVGELVPVKGQSDLILAANEVTKRFPGARFLIVGQDNSADGRYRRDLKRMVSVFDLDDRFLWLDWVEDTHELFSAMDVYVSPSHSESFGMSILEAMTCGTPVVATDTDGARELIPNESERVPIEEPVKLAAKICDMLADPDRRLRVAEEAMRAARSKFSLERMIDETEKLYFEITGNRENATSNAP